MKSYRKALWFEVPTRRTLINITGELNRCLQESGIQEGLLLVIPSIFSSGSIKYKFNFFCPIRHL